MDGSLFPFGTSRQTVQVEDGRALPKISVPNLDRWPTLHPVSTDSQRRQSVPGATILVVEDNDVLRQGIQLLLEADGFSVVQAVNGADALEKMRAACPDLILSDITMPKMDGYAFFDAVRARSEWIAIPFIFLTARGGREDVFVGKKLGAEDYLIKPVNRQELVATIHSRLARSQQLLLAQLQQAYQASLIMLSNAIELRDQYTRGHVERVMDYALTIAFGMSWSLPQLNALQLGSILHDVGKIHIQESILSKAGPLSDDEWAQMMQHPTIGAELIKNIPYLDPAIPIIRSHHERWDGAGYPDGLTGDAIPLAARVVSVADSLDAMTTTRIYREACTPEEAYIEIVAGSGKQYDPGVIRVFQSVWPEICHKRGWVSLSSNNL